MLPKDWSKARAKAKARLRTKLAREKTRQPKKRRTSPAKMANDVAVPTHGPRLNVKMIPSNWIARIRPQTTLSPSSSRNALDLARNDWVDHTGSRRVTVARTRVIGIVIDMTVAAKMVFPMKDVMR